MSTTRYLFDAVYTNNIESLNRLIQSGTCDINKRNRRGYTPLHMAVEKGSIEKVRCLANLKNCDINKQASEGYTPLHIAVWQDSIEIVRCLTNHKNCDINKQTSEGYTPLHIAVWKNSIEIVRCLTNLKNCDINKQDGRGNTPLHRAVEKDNIEIVRCIINPSQCDVNKRNSYGYTPLYLAVMKNNTENVRCLLDKNCDVNLADYVDNTPLHKAVEEMNEEIVECFLSHLDCNINLQNMFGETPLHLAAQRCNVDLWQCLLDRTNCDVNVKNLRGETPLHKAVQNHDTNHIKCILGHKECDVNEQDKRGNTPLHRTVRYCNVDMVRCIFEIRNCNVDSVCFKPLNAAKNSRNKNIVKRLLDRSTFDANIQMRREATPLHLAVRHGSINTRRYFPDYDKCDVNVRDNRGHTPLYTALTEGYLEIVRFLIQHTDYEATIQIDFHQALKFEKVLLNRREVDVDVQNKKGETPLHIAVRFNKKEIVGYLLDHTDCDVNMQNNHGITPLHSAVKYRNIDIIKRIIKERRYDVYVCNSSFSTEICLQFLYKIAYFRNVELVHVLIQHNVDVLTNHVDNQLQLVEYILSQNDFRTLFFFIQNGLYINSLTSSGENILHLLARYYIDYLYDFKFFFQFRLDFNLLNNAGHSPLMVASLLNNLPFIQVLTALPCDPVNRQNHQGHTALHLAVIGFTLIKEKLNKMKVNSIVTELCAREFYPRYLACIDILLSLGEDVNIQDNNRKTVLMLACMKNDRKLLQTLLIHGADVNIVDNHGRSALQYIDLTSNVYDLTCFNLLLSHGCRQSFNQPCLNGNTIIQNVLQFSPLWQIDETVNFINYLIYKNVNLQLLTSDDGEISYGQISLEEFSTQSRHKLRQILYLSGGSLQQITQILNFKVEETYKASLAETLREKPREKFYHFVNNLSLKDICRRVIRQNTGLAIHDRILELVDIKLLPKYLVFKGEVRYYPELTNNRIKDLQNFLLFKDINSKRLSLPYHLESVIDDDYDDDYDSYDLNTEHDDYKNDYLVFENWKYLNEVPAGLRYS